MLTFGESAEKMGLSKSLHPLVELHRFWPNLLIAELFTKREHESFFSRQQTNVFCLFEIVQMTFFATIQKKFMRQK